MFGDRGARHILPTTSLDVPMPPGVRPARTPGPNGFTKADIEALMIARTVCRNASAGGTTALPERVRQAAEHLDGLVRANTQGQVTMTDQTDPQVHAHIVLHEPMSGGGDDEEMLPVTPKMLREQLARIGIRIRAADVAKWTEPMCAAAFDWATEVDTALIDGRAVTVRERPAALSAVLGMDNPDE